MTDVWVARNRNEVSDYVIALEPMDKERDAESGYVDWIPIGGTDGPGRCASIGAAVWEVLGGPPLEPGADQRKLTLTLSVCFSVTRYEV